METLTVKDVKGIELSLVTCGDSILVRRRGSSKLIGVLSGISEPTITATHATTDSKVDVESVDLALSELLRIERVSARAPKKRTVCRPRADYVTANAPAMLFELLKQHGCISEGKGIKLMREACTILEASWDHAHGVEVTDE